ncbi:MAG: MoaD/ThiS family protein [Cyanobacteria bacterium P01_A01_bin.135]
MITVTVKLFAAYQDAFERSELTMELPEQTRVVDLCDRLIAQRPQLSAWRSQTRYGVNLQFVEPEQVLNHGDEVVLIPPVSGG